ISTHSDFTFTMPENDVVLTANFEEIMPEVFTLTLVAIPDDAGTVFGAGNYEPGVQIEINAIPNEEFEFLYWLNESDHILSTESTYNYTMPPHDILLTAKFDLMNLVDNISHDVKMFPNPATDFVYFESFAIIKNIAINDITGRIVHSLKVDGKNTAIPTELFVNGIYIVQINLENEVIIKKLQVRN
ncbi:MAG: InlB B-repeat-containing protein, partial [Bacteroidota bacterium]